MRKKETERKKYPRGGKESKNARKEGRKKALTKFPDVGWIAIRDGHVVDRT